MAQDWVPVIDVSQWQGDVDVVKMKSKLMAAGPEWGVIIRATNGVSVDLKLAQNIKRCHDAGIEDWRLGYYTFCNPKRGDAVVHARAFMKAVADAGGSPDSFLMLDVESYKQEGPNVGTMWPPEQFAPWLWTYFMTLFNEAQAHVIGYTNDAFWDPWVENAITSVDDEMAQKISWIVARYPAYSFDAYDRHPLPTTPAQWDEWAFAMARGPYPPKGGTWDGWQFSAGYNEQGAAYGCASRDLDLNFIRPEAWLRWTKRGPAIPDVIIPDPTQESTMLRTNRDPRQGFTPGAFQFILIHDGEKITKQRIEPGPSNKGVSDDPRLDPSFIPLSNEVLDGIPDYAGMKFTVTESTDVVIPPLDINLTLDLSAETAKGTATAQQ